MGHSCNRLVQAARLACAGFAVFIFFAIPQVATAGIMLDYNTYLAPDWSDIHAKLDGMTGLKMYSEVYFSQPSGDITFQGDGDVPANTPIWIITANDRQVVGEVATFAPGGYDFTSNGIAGNKHVNGVDGGAEMNESLIVAAYIGSNYCQGSFISGPMASGYTLTDERCNIVITSTILPEPATLALLAAGAAFALLRRRRAT